uniref:Uncharacterized protein n=1 Tax=Noccaea caerulescens TaxID=107243 RepID=A0A1J3HLP8_NOCCA
MEHGEVAENTVAVRSRREDKSKLESYLGLQIHLLPSLVLRETSMDPKFNLLLLISHRNIIIYFSELLCGLVE